MSNAFDGVTFRLHGLIFAIDALKVREMVGGAEWMPATGEDGTQNTIQVRGRMIPVVDLRKLFGCPSLEKKD
jgi:chemotaxis signal transduction protein